MAQFTLLMNIDQKISATFSTIIIHGFASEAISMALLPI